MLALNIMLSKLSEIKKTVVVYLDHALELHRYYTTMDFGSLWLSRQCSGKHCWSQAQGPIFPRWILNSAPTVKTAHVERDLDVNRVLPEAHPDNVAASELSSQK